MQINLKIIKQHLENFSAILIGGQAINQAHYKEFYDALKIRIENFLIIEIDLDCQVETITKAFQGATFVQTSGLIFLAKNTDLLSSAVANRLLKIVEEPPANTKFIFLAGNEQAVIQTILSRCARIQERQVLGSTTATESKFMQNPLYKFFATEFQPAQLQELITLAGNPETQDLNELFQEVWTLANDKNHCKHEQFCTHFCRLEKSCQKAARARDRIASSKLLWQALFCLTLDAKTDDN